MVCKLKKEPNTQNKSKSHLSTANANAILQSISDGVFTVDTNWKVTSFNRAAEEITGISPSEAIGKYCFEVFRSSMCETECALRKTLETGNPIVNKSCFIIDAQGNHIPISVSTAVLKDDEGNIIGGAETFRDLSDVEDLRKKVEGIFKIGDIISRSHTMKKVSVILPSIAASDSTVLIQGETGTGKELLARAIHYSGRRKEKPFIAINCGALPDTLLESELFGYKAGAFTGANKDKPGRFALAEGGTLFLDEIGEISQMLQVKLLRVLQEKNYDPLGATQSAKADVRIVAATHKDIYSLVKQGLFREDLFYRIHVIRIDLPPLRERKEDIPLLLDHFIAKFNKIQRKNIAGITQESLALLMSYNWPGNIRELENFIERAFILCSEGMIEPKHLSENFSYSETKVLVSPFHISAIKQTIEAEAILEALKRNNFNRLAAAKELGIHKSTFFRKIKSLGISLPSKQEEN